MRIAEKTVELNFCKGFPQALGHDLLWFGLTQKQEAKAGFDACAKSGSTLMLFQLKASRVILKDGTRRFLAEHEQMQTLRDQVKMNRRVYYVLPCIGTTAEICGGLCFSHCSRYLDVSQLPTVIPPPLSKGKNPPSLRKNKCHYLDMAPTLDKATIHSEPFEVKLLSVDSLADSASPPGEIGSDSLQGVHRQRSEELQREDSVASDFDEFWLALGRVDRAGLVGAYAV